MSELLDNRRFRMDTLKEIVHSLHRGTPAEALQEEFATILGEVGAGEIAAMESELIAEGLAAEEVQRLCDVHAAVLGGHLGGDVTVPKGHPVDTFRRENRRLVELVEGYREVARSLAGVDPPAELASRWRELHGELAKVEGHYRRKEYLLFPYLEKAGIAGPPKVMWGKHDEIRELLAAAGELAAAADGLDGEAAGLAAATVLTPLLEEVAGMVDKEERILWPMALEHLAVSDWEQIRDQWNEMGEGLVRPAGFWLPVVGGGRAAPPPREPAPADGEVRLPSGTVSVAQLAGILDTLPLDVTFVDADDRVAYFSEGADRVFERNRAILGRRVQDCHPPASVHIVQKVVDDLRAGRRDVAEFWIQLHGRFVHIRYFAVRGADGAYLGTVELTQDVTRVRALEGERRLLAEAAGGSAA